MLTYMSYDRIPFRLPFPPSLDAVSGFGNNELKCSFAQEGKHRLLPPRRLRHLECLPPPTFKTMAPPLAVSNEYRDIKKIDTIDFERRLRSPRLFRDPADTPEIYLNQLESTMIRILDDVAPILRG